MAAAQTKVPSGAKKPSDHKKRRGELVDYTFTFEHDGREYTSLPMIDVLTPGFLRKARRLDDMDFMFTVLEELFAGQDDALAAMDDMSWDDFGAMSERLKDDMGEKVGAQPGE